MEYERIELPKELVKSIKVIVEKTRLFEDEKDFINQALMSVIHETGHGLYEQGLRSEWFGTPLGESISLGIHESQSRLWENLIGRSLPFWKYFFPKLQKTFPDQLRDV